MTGPIVTSEGSGKSHDSAEYDDPLYLHPSDNTIVTIIGFKLVGTENFRIWLNSMTRSLKGRNKLGFVDGSVIKPTDDNAKILKWERANAVVCSWILGSLSEPVYANHASTEYASTMWKELYETYHKSDASVIFNLHQKINSINQSSLSVSDYYNKLDALWKEFDGLTNLPGCVCEASTGFNDHSKLIKLMQFLNGLDDTFNQVKSHILLMKPLPNVRTAFSIISREESFQKNGSLSSNQLKVQTSVFNSRFKDSRNNENRSQTQLLQCKHCGIKGHTIDRCNKVVGYPKDYKHKNNFSNNGPQNDFGKLFFNNNANSSKFLCLLNESKSGKNVPAIANMEGIFCNSVAVCQDFQNRDVDSGAYQHMIASERNFRASSSHCFISKFTWHRRLGHPADQVLNVLRSQLCLDNGSLSPCEVCFKAKQTRVPLSMRKKITTKMGELIYLDVWGPHCLATADGFKYFLTIIDDFSTATWVYLLKSKEEVFNSFLAFVNILLNQFDTKIKTVRSDNGTEFVDNKMKSFFESKGILHQTSCVHTPQQNEIVERKHSQILNVSRSLLFQSNLPLKYWGEAVLTSVFLINRIPSSVLNGLSPFELVYKRPPKLDFLRIFGCLCIATRFTNFDKFSERVEKTILIGYSVDKKEYKLLSLETGLVFFSRDVTFYETVFPFKMKSDQTTVLQSRDLFSFDEPPFPDCVTTHSDFRDLGGTCRTDGVRAVHPLEGNQLVPSLVQRDVHMPWSNLIDGVSTGRPMADSEFVPGCSQGDRVHMPQSNDGEILSQRVAEENNERYTALSRVSSLGSCKLRRESKLRAQFNDFVIDNKYKYNINKVVSYSFLDKENKCFVSKLNKTIEPRVYHTKGDICVCKLLKSLSVLKQVPRKWNEKLCSSLFDFRFIQSVNDCSMITRSNNKSFVVLLVYGDGIILTVNDGFEITKVKEFLKSQFLVKGLRKLEYCVSIEVTDISGGLCLTQRKNCIKLLHEFGMLGCKPVRTPLKLNFVFKRTKSDKLLPNIKKFQKLIGKLKYMTITRPDFVYAVPQFSQCMHSSCKSHLEVSFRFFWFLKQNLRKGIRIKRCVLGFKRVCGCRPGKMFNLKRVCYRFVGVFGDSLVL
ncbi:hypothetical protein L2E82_11867 [Cichorium intybus]|uniref:Uncharacterized protein n=1 Tax=Cichorium intybus TaxID=13427 RepID=A0ACB9GFQ5_CICIN|nr:hypothetical protein L2E82_11867 [Cichorium intybus]